jgi:flagellar assembly protein FliH
MTSILRTPPVGPERRTVALGAPHASAAAHAASAAPAGQVDAAGAISAPRPAMHAPMWPLPASHEGPRSVDQSVVAAAPAEDSIAAQAFQKGFDAGHAEGVSAGHGEGLQRGFAQGLRDGEATAAETLAQQVQRFAAGAAAIEHATAQVEALVEDDAVEALFAAVLQIAGLAHADRDTLRETYRAALAQVRDRRELQLHLHPEDLAFLQAQAGADEMLLAGAPGIAWVADPSIQLGGCKIAGRGGELDARLDQQLATLKDVLTTARAQRPGAGA